MELNLKSQIYMIYVYIQRLNWAIYNNDSDTLQYIRLTDVSMCPD